MNTKIRRESPTETNVIKIADLCKRMSFPVVTISRGDVNHALGLSPDHEFGMSLSYSQMVLVAKRLGDAHAELGGWNTLRDILDVLGITEGESTSDILDTSKEAKWLLLTLERTLYEIQTRIVDENGTHLGTHFGCFPFGWRSGNRTCKMYTSPVCVLCRALNTGTWRGNRG